MSKGEGEVVVKTGVLTILRALRGPQQYPRWTLATLLRTPCPELGGATPLEWMRDPQHDVATLENLARTWAEEWSR